MRFKVDENLPQEIADLLRQAQHDAVTVYDQQLAGVQDQEILDVCGKEARALVTLDLDFADIRTYPPQQFRGLIVLRTHYQDKPHLIQVMKGILPLMEREPIDRQLRIVEESRVRIRGGQE